MDSNEMVKKLTKFKGYVGRDVSEDFVDFIDSSSKEELIFYMLNCKNIREPDRVLYFLNGELTRKITVENEKEAEFNREEAIFNRKMSIGALVVAGSSIAVSVLVAIFK
ncbi:hypothetical protein ACFL20_10060 [Spirochaetota bacterium]